MALRQDNPVSAALAGILDQRASRSLPELEMLDPSFRLDGRTYVVTGANSGLGYGVAEALARRGATVLMACRSQIPEAGAAISRSTGSDRVSMLRVDLSDFASIHRFADALADRAKQGSHIDGIVCNAGVMPSHDRPTQQGFELMFGVNYLANYLLLRRVIADGVLQTGDDRRPRVVMVASEAHRSGAPLDWSSFGEYHRYGTLDGMRWYGHSKLATITFARELARRHPELAVHAMCPGAVASNMAREAPAWVKPALDLLMRQTFATPAVAAEPVVHLLSAPDLEGETAWYLHMRRKKEPAPAALDEDNGRRIWSHSERLVASAMRGVVGPERWALAPER